MNQKSFLSFMLNEFHKYNGMQKFGAMLCSLLVTLISCDIALFNSNGSYQLPVSEGG